jgi:hypothetical protein
MTDKQSRQKPDKLLDENWTNSGQIPWQKTGQIPEKFLVRNIAKFGISYFCPEKILVKNRTFFFHRAAVSYSGYPPFRMTGTRRFI